MPRKRMSKEQVDNILKLRDQGKLYPEITKLTGATIGQMNNIFYGIDRRKRLAFVKEDFFNEDIYRKKNII